VGTVLDIENPPSETVRPDWQGLSRYHFRVDENINGIDTMEVDVYSGRADGICSYHFELGKTYLVNPDFTNGQYFASSCSDTAPVADAEPFLSELRARKDRKPHASLYGVLRGSEDSHDPISNVTIEISAEKQKLSALTDAGGIFKFYGVPAGTYNFSARLPASMRFAKIVLTDATAITLPENACSQQDLDAKPLGQVHGTVIGPGGTAIRNGDVTLFRWDRYKKGDKGWTEFLDENGDFEFSHVSPGIYVLVFHNDNKSDPRIPYPRTFFPAASEFSSAEPIIVKDDGTSADIYLSGGPPTAP
jgi:hypothetical protein